MRSSTRLAFRAVLVVLVGLGTTACYKRVNRINQYQGRINDVLITTSAPPQPIVQIGRSNQQGGLLAAASEVAGAVVSMDLRKRIVRAAPGGRVRDHFSVPYREQVLASFGYAEVGNGAPCDARIDVQTQNYGVSAPSVESQLTFFFNARVDMFDCNDGVKIWEMWVNHSEPITDRHLGADPRAEVQAAGAMLNLIAVGQLTDDQMQFLFDSLAENAGYAMARQMEQDAQRRLTKKDYEEMAARKQRALTGDAPPAPPEAAPAGPPSLGVVVVETGGGLMVDQVTPGASAHAAGVVPRDLILSVDGEAVTTIQRLVELVQAHAHGDTLSLVVVRYDPASRSEQQVEVRVVLQ